jgi:hypothetical protein
LHLHSRTSEAAGFILKHSYHVVVHSFPEDIVIKACRPLVEMALDALSRDSDVFHRSFSGKSFKQSQRSTVLGRRMLSTVNIKINWQQQLVERSV